MNNALHGVATNPAALHLKDAGTTYRPDAWTSAWKPLLAGSAYNPMGVDWFAMVFGLGFVLSFGYWCTNFLVVQRAMAARNMTAARRTPLIAAVPKMLFPVLVILPGMIAVALTSMPSQGRLPPAAARPARRGHAMPRPSRRSRTRRPWNLERRAAAAMDAKTGKRKKHGLDQDKIDALVKARGQALNDKETRRTGASRTRWRRTTTTASSSRWCKKYCPPGLLGLALTALLASFMSGMAGNVTAFNTVWTYDLYQAYIARTRATSTTCGWAASITVVGILLSIACAYFASHWYNNAMDIIQLVFGFVNAPALRHVPARHVLDAHAPAPARSSACWAASAPRPCSTG